jgi:hypothetical protein
MFWRAVEKSDIDGPWGRAGRPPGSWIAIFGTWLAKTQPDVARVKGCDAPSLVGLIDLFDGDREPSDQPCDLVQLLGSCASTACASRVRHSSSLIAGMSLGTIDGTGLIRAVSKSGIELPQTARTAWRNLVEH